MSRYRLAACAVVAVVAAGCADDAAPDNTVTTDRDAVRIAAFSSAEPGWDATIAEFSAEPNWPGAQPEYGASVDLVERLLDGEGADVVHLAAAWDMDGLVRAEIVPPDWDNGTTGGFPCSSVVTMVVRAGNPRAVHDWPDLLQPGLEVVTPSPVNVGAGRWALLAAYAAASNGNQDPEAGKKFLRRLILEHVAVGPTTVQQAREEFLDGRGDVLLLSEAATLQLVSDGAAVELVLPPQTLRMDFPLAVTTMGLQKPTARRLVDFVLSPAGERLWAQTGFRPTDPAPGIAQFPDPERLWTIADLGGWGVIGPRFFNRKSGFITGLFIDATQ